MKKVLILIIAGIIIAVLFQPLFNNGRTRTANTYPTNTILPMILFADPLYADSDTIRLPNPIKPPPPTIEF